MTLQDDAEQLRRDWLVLRDAVLEALGLPRLLARLARKAE